MGSLCGSYRYDSYFVNSNGEVCPDGNIFEEKVEYIHLQHGYQTVALRVSNPSFITNWVQFRMAAPCCSSLGITISQV